MKNKRTQPERSAATRAALVSAARVLFTERGFADVGAEEIARVARVTRGALYHQFDGLRGLFLAVFEQVEADLVERLAGSLAAQLGEGPTDDGPDDGAVLKAGVDAWLVACQDPEVHRLALVEAPTVLGWQVWREVGLRTSLGLVEASLAAAMTSGAVAAQPSRPLAHVLVGALEEAALYVAHATDPAAAREEVRSSLHALVDGLRGHQ